MENKQGSDIAPPRVVFFRPLITGFLIGLECSVCGNRFENNQTIVGGLPVCVYDCPHGHRIMLPDEFFEKVLDIFYPPGDCNSVTESIQSKTENWYKDYKLQYMDIEIGPSTERMLGVVIGQEEFLKAVSHG